MMSYWLNTRWAVFAKAEFMQVLPFTNQRHRSAGVLAVRTLLALPAFLYSLVAGLTLLQGDGMARRACTDCAGSHGSAIAYVLAGLQRGETPARMRAGMLQGMGHTARFYSRYQKV